MDQKTKVLIIGAGPTGLMAACQLRRQGIEVMIIDKKDGPTKESRAMVVHARSLEIYDQLGIVNEALLKGEIVRSAQFIVRGKKVRELHLDKMGEGDSPFPFLLMLEQSKNEELLYAHLKKLGSDVEWNTEMISLLQDEKGICVAVKKDKETWDIKPDYLIAADGAGSPVRNALEIPFNGDTYERIFYVADTAVEWEWGSEALSVYLSKKTFIGLFPMQGKDRFRVIGILPLSFQNEHPQTFEEIVPHIQKELEVPLKFKDTAWFSVYRLHHRCIQQFRAGSVFFAGDAAHIHSPAGGQGMNTGLQDAYNLAWKLALVIKESGSDTLLDTYQQERMPLANSLLRSTDRMFGLLTSGKWYHRILRLRFLPLLLPFFFRFKKARQKAFRTVSQIGVKYINSDLTVNRTTQALTIKAGERFPFLCTKGDDRVYQLMKESRFHALVFTTSAQSMLVAEMKKAQEELGNLLQVIDLSSEEKMMATLKIKGDIVVLVRPDHYIGLITDEGAKVVGDYLKRLTIEKKPDGIMLQQTHP